MDIPSDPLEDGGIRRFGERLRKGEITSEAAVKAYLGRIEALEPHLRAYEFVAADQALAVARSLDRLLTAGTDLGPLMGVPVAVKDLLAVEGMPTTAGSKVEVSDLIGAEGAFVKALKGAGCVVLGKTRTVEFALGGAGINRVRGTPRNPWDADVFRAPGGSSSGSAVAMAAGLCGFAIGSDTGGSVRGPAAFCGVFGLKTTKGLWPTDGVFPLSPTLDTIGLLTGSAADAALIAAALQGRPVTPSSPPRGLRLGRPDDHFFDNLDKEVERCT
ncbi:MAG: amidase, partial [Rhodospirillales bacterium]|nr:amidase [Rhodospirillales bacterium]